RSHDLFRRVRGCPFSAPRRRLAPPGRATRRFVTMSVMLDPSLVDDLDGRVAGRVLRPGDEAYEAARRVHNGLIDRHPSLIVRCRSAGDAAAAVRFARAAGLEVSIRGGGHNVAGRAVMDDAVMIDLA